MTKIAQIIVAAGKGLRAGGQIPKQYQDLMGKPVLWHTLRQMLSSERISETIIVIAKGDTRIHAIIDDFPAHKISTTLGGATRTDSVRAGLEALSDNAPDYVLIHDAARPFISHLLIENLTELLKTTDAVVPVLPVTDALKHFDDDTIGTDINRANVRRVRTPQGFDYKKILNAMRELPQNASFSDDIAVALHAGMEIKHCSGDENNIKLTYPEDFIKARQKLMQDTYMAVGNGFDVHQVTKGEHLWICGIKIPCGFSLLGHSDADIGLHAVTDAILGAICFGDIGDHFPPSDPQWKGAASDKFLKFALDQATARGGELMHVDVTIICEKPKVKPYREEMRARVADILSLPLTRVSVKATTTEKLGFTGRHEGLAAQATASVRMPIG